MSRLDEADHWFQRLQTLGTSKEARVRDGQEAVAAATKACELSAWREADAIQALALGLAETGDWEKAVSYQEKALALAAEGMKSRYQAVLKQLRRKEPWRDE